MNVNELARAADRLTALTPVQSRAVIAAAAQSFMATVREFVPAGAGAGPAAAAAPAAPAPAPAAAPVPVHSAPVAGPAPPAPVAPDDLPPAVSPPKERVAGTKRRAPSARRAPAGKKAAAGKAKGKASAANPSGRRKYSVAVQKGSSLSRAMSGATSSNLRKWATANLIDFTDEVASATHLVADEILLSPKFLEALANGATIVTSPWLLNPFQDNSTVGDGAGFVLQGDMSPYDTTMQDFRQRMAHSSRGPSILADVSMFIDRSAELGSSRIATAAGASVHTTQRSLPDGGLVLGGRAFKMTPALQKKNVTIVDNEWLRKAIVTGVTRTGT
jgi:hypothetical protein